MGRQIVRLNQNVAVDEVASVVSAIINTSTVPRRRRRFTTHSDATTTSTEYDDHLKIDRILYNAFGDIMSIARNSEIEWMAQYNDEQNAGISLNNAQNDAIENFLMDFIQEQRDSFVEAIGNLCLSQEMPEPPEENVNNVNNEQIVPSEGSIVNNTAVVNADNSEASSIISVQRVVAPYPVAAARESFDQDRSVSHISGENVSSNAATIHSDPRMVLQPRASSNPKVTSNYDSKTPMTSKSYSPPENSYGNASQFSFDGLSFHSDIGNMHYSPSSNGSSHTQRHQNDPFYFDPTQNFQFDMDFNQSQQPITQSKFFTQPLNQSQSQNDLMRSPNDDSFLDVQFSQQQEDFGDLGRPFTFQSFSSKTIPDSQQQRRPNLSNIRKNTVTNRSLTHLPTGSNSGNSYSDEYSFISDLMG